MSEPINAVRALELLEEAVAEKGEDYVYPYDNCVYTNVDGTPSCLVGLAMAKAGFVIDVDDAYANEAGVDESDEVFPGLLTERGRAVMEKAQCVQDSRIGDFRGSWGKALGIARAEAVFMEREFGVE